MYCKICGSREEDKPKWFDGKWVEYYPTKHNSLCRPCASETPDKMGREEFVSKYFAGEAPPPSIVKEFYEDYRASIGTFEEYVASTVSAI